MDHMDRMDHTYHMDHMVQGCRKGGYGGSLPELKSYIIISLINNPAMNISLINNPSTSFDYHQVNAYPFMS